MISLAAVSEEWLKVKDVPSLYKHYPNAVVYQRWRARFLRLGYLKTKQNQKGLASLKSRRDYARNYARKWRKQNPARAKEINYAYWRRRLMSDAATTATETPVV